MRHTPIPPDTQKNSNFGKKYKRTLSAMPDNSTPEGHI